MAARLARLRGGNAILCQTLQDLRATVRAALLTTVADVSGEATGDPEAGPDPLEVVRFLATRPAGDPTLPVRIRSALARGDFVDVADVLRRFDDELLCMRNIGSKAIEDLGSWVESTSSGLGLLLSRQEVRLVLASAPDCATTTIGVGFSSETGTGTDALAEALAALPAAALDLPLRMLGALPARLRRALAERGCSRIGSVVQLTCADLLAEQGVGIRTVDRLVAALSDLAQRTAPRHPEASLDADALREALTVGDRLDETLRAFFARLSAREQEIVGARIFTTTRHTLGEVGSHYGITRERVRQIEAKALRQLDSGGDLRTAVAAGLYRARRRHNGLLTLTALVEHEPFFATIDAEPGLLLGFLAAVDAAHRVVDWPGVGWCVVPRGLERFDKVRTELRRVFVDDGADCDGSTREAAVVVREFVDGLAAGELFEAVAGLCGLERCDNGGWRRLRTLRELILEIVHRDARPWRLDEIAGALRESHELDVPEPRLRSHLDAMRTEDHSLVRYGRSTYCSAQALVSWDPYVDRVRDEIVPMLAADPAALVSTDDLLAWAIEQIDDWPRGMPVHALELLLFRCDGVRFAGRWLWQSASVDHRPVRQAVADIAAAILVEHGAPMRRRELIAELRRRRSTGQNPVFAFPVYADAGFLYLIERDVGISAAAYRAWFDAVADGLATGTGTVNGAELAQMLRRHVAHEHGAEPRDLLSILGNESRFVYDRQRHVLRLADHVRRSI